VKRALDRLEDSFASLALLVMVVLPLSEIIARRFFGRGIPGSGPIVSHLTLWVGFLGAAIAAREGKLLALATGTFLKGGWRRTADILASTGVRIGGNDFDKELSLSLIMPEIGYRTTYGEKNIEVPLHPFHQLAEWSKVNFIYTPKALMQTRQILHQSHDPSRYVRLLRVLEKETGHALLAAAERAKIVLTADEEHQALFDFIEDDFVVNIGRAQFEISIREEVRKISAAATKCLHEAQVKPEAIDLVILTGGSTEVPVVQAEFKRLFPQAAIADENKLSSVGLGLAYDSQNKFSG